MAEFTQYAISADAPVLPFIHNQRGHRQRRLSRRVFDEAAETRFFVEQGGDFGDQFSFLLAGFGQPGGALFRRSFQRGIEKRFDSLPAFGGHCGVPCCDSTQGAMQPTARQLPFAFYRSGRDAQHFRRLFNRQSAEIAQLDQPHLLRIETR